LSLHCMLSLTGLFLGGCIAATSLLKTAEGKLSAVKAERKPVWAPPKDADR
jgi:hypothetical protein